jgi:dTDP-4-dehydrorhamnose 3,5-epimerase
LADEVVVIYNVSAYYSQALERGIFWNDPEIALPWPVKGTDIIVSEKDARLPLLREFVSPFPYDGHPCADLRTSHF